jgi:hypothetical protein
MTNSLERNMQFLKQLVAAVLIATTGAAALPSSALAGADEPSAQRGSGFAPDFYNREQDRYHDYIVGKRPENRRKSMVMQAPPLSASAGAGEPSGQRSSGFAPDFYNREVDRYREYIARTTPENRAKSMVMQDKLMHTEMDRKSTPMKMDVTKVGRDKEFSTPNSGYPFQNTNR